MAYCKQWPTWHCSCLRDRRCKKRLFNALAWNSNSRTINFCTGLMFSATFQRFCQNLKNKSRKTWFHRWPCSLLTQIRWKMSTIRRLRTRFGWRFWVTLQKCLISSFRRDKRWSIHWSTILQRHFGRVTRRTGISRKSLKFRWIGRIIRVKWFAFILIIVGILR